MSGVLVELTLRQRPPLRVDLRGLLPAALASLPVAGIEQLRFGHGRHAVPLAEWFGVQRREVADLPDGSAELRLVGDCSRFDRIGTGLMAGRIVVEGAVGDYAGAGMSGGEVHVQGHAGLLAACEMAGGLLRVDGDVGDFAASALPGSMDGMRGGSFIVGGNAGQRFGDRMRRGTAMIRGDAGDLLASRMVAGTIAVAGSVGAHPGYGMRRGSLVLAGPAPAIVPTFVPAIAEVPVAWQLLARSLARHGGAFETLPQRRIVRHLGDLSAQGKGELMLVEP
ncbi:formylmethanofuran dehydrogenase subunit C [Aquincola sp. J276]|uniref:formylmethanofuran dehydrogenase subunit C n=1 Tax=Aquincola sp. J276 TaxID=2898432 RepID=UPI0021512768|nr:formylmethanofuran dehydrogenase subunit C [Aquincola sp. J276]MCR5868823.1 formylmethanofuran dehydrogenase subunit C [Aquincola sp. J276]